MVGAELGLEAVGRVTERRRHHARIGDDEVKRLVARRQRGGTGTDTRERGEVELDQLERPAPDLGISTDLGRGAFGLREVAGGAHDPGAAPGEGPGRLDPQAGRHAGHQHAHLAQVRAFKDLVGRGRRIESPAHDRLVSVRSQGPTERSAHADTTHCRRRTDRSQSVSGGLLRFNIRRRPPLIKGSSRWGGKIDRDPTRPLRADARRNRGRLIDAAKAMFSEGGAETSLEAIARAAGVGIGTLYRHFPTRDALIEAVYRTETQHLAQAAPRFSETLPPVEALRAWLRLFVDHIATKQVMSPVLASMVAGPSELYAESGAQVKAAIASLVDRAVASGDIRLDIDPLDLLRALAGVAGISSAPGWEESAKRLVDILIAGVRIPPAD